jgi:hypothetical protein
MVAPGPLARAVALCLVLRLGIRRCIPGYTGQEWRTLTLAATSKCSLDMLKVFA